MLYTLLSEMLTCAAIELCESLQCSSEVALFGGNEITIWMTHTEEFSFLSQLWIREPAGSETPACM